MPKRFVPTLDATYLAQQGSRSSDPYKGLLLAIVHRALEDAAGRFVALGGRTPDQIQAEARVWLADQEAVAALLDLADVQGAPGWQTRGKQGRETP